MKPQRGDVVATNATDYLKRKLIGIVVAVEIGKPDAVGVDWICCPPEEDYRRLHPTYTRCIDNYRWLDVIGHIDLPPTD